MNQKNQTHKMQQQINIELPPEQAEGIYSNLALISHSPAEFVIDFTRILPGIPKSKVYARIIMTPQHAKSLLQALEENVKRYEEQYGEIVIQGKPGSNKTFGFQAPTDTSK